MCYITAVLLCTVNVAVFTLFENRYQLMFGRETFWEEIRKQLLAVNYVLAFLYPLPSFFRYPEQTSALAMVLESLPPLPNTLLYHQITVYAIELRFFVIPIIFIIGMLAAAGFGLGLLDKLGISLQHQCTLFTAIIWSVLVATVTVFESRYNLMYGRETLWAKFRYPLLAANWISAFFSPLPAFLAFPEQAEALKVVMETLPPLPDYILEHHIVVYMTDLHFFHNPDDHHDRILKYIGVSTEIQTYSIVMVYAMVGTAILTLFENRYFLMFARYHAWKNYRIKFLIINYFLASCFFIPAYFAIPEQTEALRKVFEVLPQLPDVILNAPLFVLANDLGLVLLSVLFMTILLVSEIGILALLLYLNMKKRTRRMATSQYTLNLQKKFLRSIYLQVSTPFLILITPLSYTFFSVVFGFYNQAANNMCTIFFALHGLVSTLTCILIHKTYRKSCFSLLTFNILQKGTTSSIVVPSRSNRGAFPSASGNANSKVKTLIYSVNQKIRV
ncbi:hypothetical protein L3Y34_006978 [Caenorhabditis briggsae]|uniref:Uncharacterized protein n=1 Tax=Caenorhabditis briggsae TaxID=6238 RepID=A0AAE9A5K7_CAEBR|nr:hypothetical protein L3Y34_006978 [Caenorhabditis briggsae]